MDLTQVYRPMHELSLCEDLLTQVLRLAEQHQALNIAQITVSLGALSGVEPVLLTQAFEIIKMGTAASNARLIITVLPVRIRCQRCRSESDADPNMLRCPVCQSSETHLLSGGEFILSQVELDIIT